MGFVSFISRMLKRCREKYRQEIDIDLCLYVFDKLPTNPAVIYCFNRYPFLQKFANNFLILFLLRYLFPFFIVLFAWILLDFCANTCCPVYYGDFETCQYPIAFGYVFVAEVIVNLFLCRFTLKRNRIDSLVPADLLAKFSSTFISDAVEEDHVISDGKICINDHEDLSSDPNEPNGDKKNVQKWRYCRTCKTVAPPRCHHCPLCDFCVLKKDHHCFVTGACVGHSNQRYFIVMLFWATVGTGYATIYLIRFLSLTSESFLDSISPATVIRWMFTNRIPFNRLCHVIMFAGSLSTFAMSFFFFLYQSFLVFRNETMYERWRNQTPPESEFSASIMQRIRIVFGSNFWLNFLLPLPTKNHLHTSLANFIDECTKEN